MFSGGLEILADGDAGFFVFDAGVFEAEAFNVGLGTGSEDDTVDTDHFFFTVCIEDNAVVFAVVFDGDDFGVGNDHDTKLR